VVRSDASPEAGRRLSGISGIGGFAQVIDVESVVGGDPDIVVDRVIRHPEDDIDAPCRFRQGTFRIADGIGTGHVDIVQVSGHGAEPDPALPVLAEGGDRVVGERGILRMVVPEHQVPDLPAYAVAGGGQPKVTLAVEVHGTDRGRRDGGGGTFYV
jgi:hypothetical protein